MYDHFWNRQQKSCEEAFRVAEDTHHWVLVAATLLEGHIKRLGHSLLWMIQQPALIRQSLVFR